MAFRIRDLMISSLSEGEEQPQQIASKGCRPATAMFCVFSNLRGETVTLFSPVLGISGPCGPCKVQEPREASASMLDALKEQLRQQIAAIEERQAAAEEKLLPQSVEEVDALTQKLTEALEELRSRREELLRKRHAGAGG